MITNLSAPNAASRAAWRASLEKPNKAWEELLSDAAISKRVAVFTDSGLSFEFCPTGEGGGVDPTCSPAKGALGDHELTVQIHKREAVKEGELIGNFEHGFIVEEFTEMDSQLEFHSSLSEDEVEAFRTYTDTDKYMSMNAALRAGAAPDATVEEIDAAIAEYTDRIEKLSVAAANLETRDALLEAELQDYAKKIGSLARFKADSDVKQKTEILAEMFTKAPPLQEDLNVVRGVKNTVVPVLEKLRPGDEFVDLAFSSTSTSRAVALEFANNVPGKPRALLQVTVRKGTRVLQYDGMEEAEVLLPPATKFTVTGITRINDVPHIQAIAEPTR